MFAPIQVLALALLVQIVPAAAQTREPAGHIVDLSGPPDGVELHRSGPQPAILWAPIYPGDEVRIRPDDRLSAATLQLGKRLVVVRGCATPTRSTDVCAPFRVPDGSVGILGQLADLVGRLVNTPPPPADVNAQGRHGDGPRIGGLGVQSTRIAAGTRPLALVVKEGKPPFSVIVKQGETTLGPFTAPAMLVVTPPVTLREGPVRIEITGADGKTTFLSLMVMRTAPVPKVLDGSTGADPYEAMLAAGALAAHPSKEWTLEALSRLAALSGEYPPAGRLLSELAARIP